MRLGNPWVLLAACAPFIGAQPNSPATPLTAPEIFRRVAPSVVLIEMALANDAEVHNGTGFIVSADGKIVTNYHVIAHSKAGTVKLANGDIYEIRDVFEIDKRRDLAIIAIRAVDLTPVQLGRSNALEVGQSVFTVSNPLGALDNTFSHGLVSAKRRVEGTEWLQISAPVTTGSSGAPLFDSRGEVVGVVVAGLPEVPSANFAVPVDYVRGMLGASAARPLAAVYEPEPAKDSTSSEQESSAVAVPNPSEEFRRGSLVYLEQRLYKWRLEDAKKELGEPARSRPAYVDGQVTGTIYAFPDPTRSALEFELTFNDKSTVLTMVIAYPLGASLESAKRLFGNDYIVRRHPNGEKLLTYRNRRLMLRVGNRDQIISIGVF